MCCIILWGFLLNLIIMYLCEVGLMLLCGIVIWCCVLKCCCLMKWISNVGFVLGIWMFLCFCMICIVVLVMVGCG